MKEHVVFSDTVVAQLKYYVYRLIDPRKGETFYVGKGVGNRVFAHARGEIGIDTDSDALPTKIRRIREIQRDGFDVIHLIHRHGMDEQTALEVEAALIDAFPEASNVVGGQGSDEYGLMHTAQIIERYEAKQVIFYHSAIIINVGRTVSDKGSYEAVRYAWRLDPKKASQAEVVLAVDQGLIIDVFVADKWLEATESNFPGIAKDWLGRRWGFVGHEAPEEIAKLYKRYRIPDSMRKRGAANPIKYAMKNGQVED